MRTFVLVDKDATIYEKYPTVNTGLDEIIEVGKIKQSINESSAYTASAARILLNFDVGTADFTSSANYYLNLFIANAVNVNRYQQIEVYPISRSWEEGSGYFIQDVRNVSDGVTWQKASPAVSWSMSGSDYVTTPSASYTFSKVPIQDVRIDISDIIRQVVSGSNVTPWNGLLLKFPAADEISQTNIGNIKFFSSNTHTVFAPKLEVVWNDQSFSTGSLKAIPNGKVSIIPKNLKESYTSGEIDKIRLIVRDQFPDKKFDSTQRYKSTYYLPSESYYRVKDKISGVVIYDFDTYSAISCDSSGSYFTLDTSWLDVNRYYTVDLKIKQGNLVFFPSFEYTFRIDKNA